MDYSIYSKPDNKFLRESITQSGSPISILFDLRRLKQFGVWVVFGKKFRHKELIDSLTTKDNDFIGKVCTYYGWDKSEVI